MGNRKKNNKAKPQGNIPGANYVDDKPTPKPAKKAASQPPKDGNSSPPKPAQSGHSTTPSKADGPRNQQSPWGKPEASKSPPSAKPPAPVTLPVRAASNTGAPPSNTNPVPQPQPQPRPQQAPARPGNTSMKDAETESAKPMVLGALPARPSHSKEMSPDKKLGGEVKLLANHFPLNPPKGLSFYWYSIQADLHPDEKKKNPVSKETEQETEQVHSQEGGRGKGTSPEGIKLGKLITQMLRTNDIIKKKHASGRLVTDFKANIISLDDLLEGKEETEIVCDLSYLHEYEVDRSKAKRYRLIVKPETPGTEETRLYHADQHNLRVLHLDSLIANMASSNPATREDAISKQVPSFVQTLNIWLRHHSKLRKFGPSTPDQAVTGTKVFPISGAQVVKRFPKSVLQVFAGCSSSIRVGEEKLLANVNISHGAFFQSGNLQGILDYYLGRTPLTDRKLEYLNKTLRGLKVVISVRTGAGRLCSIRGLACRSDINEVRRRNQEIDKDPAKAARLNMKKEREPVFLGTEDRSIGFRAGRVQYYPKDSDKLTLVYDHITQKYGKHDKYDRRNPVTRDDLLVNVGKEGRPRYYPTRLCNVVEGQFYRQRLAPEETSNMIKVAKKSPADCLSYITGEGKTTVGFVKDNNSPWPYPMTLMAPSDTLLGVTGRILARPQIAYSGGLTVEVDGRFQPNRPRTAPGTWNLVGDLHYTKPGTMPKKWAMLRINPWDEVNERCISGRKTAYEYQDDVPPSMRKRGIRIDGSEPESRLFYDEVNYDGSAEQSKLDIVGRKIAQLAHGDPKNKIPKNEFLLITLPNKDKVLYNYVKRIADVEVGIRNVCLNQAQFQKFEDQYVDNVWLKVNLKLGGTNHVLRNPPDLLKKDRRVMIVGLDVTHPSPGSSDSAPSIAGMVANYDSDLGQWPAAWAFQQKSKEEVAGKRSETVQKLLKQHLNRWHDKNNGTLPDKILVYRDGVSEGQFQLVRDNEVTAIQQACAETYAELAPPGSKLPKITVVVVVKRHHTRFFVKKDVETRSAEVKKLRAQGLDPANMRLRGPDGNPVAGTAVGTGVTGKFLWEFFLQAHAPLQGVARPAQYVVVYDEIFRAKRDGTNIPVYANPAGELEKVTHALCYVFGRTTGAIGVAAPARLADLVCDRARIYNAGVYGNEEEGTHRTVHKNLEECMYYI